jgi:hypothetical protein
MRSPSTEPPENGLDGSMATTPTDFLLRRRCSIIALVSVDLPAPGRAGDADRERVPAGTVDA